MTDVIFPIMDSQSAPEINWHLEDIELAYELNQAHLESWISDTILSESKTLTTLSIILCSDDYLLEINREHLDHDYYTDIITFQYSDDPISGDLFISVDRVEDNATQRDLDPQDELHRVIIHGVLHLIGYSDKAPDEQKVMRSKEDHYLQVLSGLEG